MDMRLMDEAAAGAVGGIAGGMAMSAMMLLGQQVGIVRTPVPLQVERQLEARMEAAERTGPVQEQRPTRTGRQAMMHALYGTVTAVVADRARAALR